MKPLQTSEHTEKIKLARARLEILYADTGASTHRLTQWQEREALRAVLDELHRLNLAVSEQRATLQAVADRQNAEIRRKKATRKPADARSIRPTAQRTTENKRGHRP